MGFDQSEGEVRDSAWRLSQVRAHQTDGSASANALRWECARMPVWSERSNEEEGYEIEGEGRF